MAVLQVVRTAPEDISGKSGNTNAYIDSSSVDMADRERWKLEMCEVEQTTRPNDRRQDTVCCANWCFFLFQKMAVSVALNGAGSLPCCIIWCLHAFPTKAEKNMFFGVTTSVDETSLGQFVALYGACDTI